jgi:hypothetical protein
MTNPNIHKEGKQHRFSSTNQPKNRGNKKGNKHYRTVLKEIANSPIYDFYEKGLKKFGFSKSDMKGMTNREAKVIFDFFNSSIKGNAGISRQIAEYDDGFKLPQKINVTGEIDTNIQSVEEVLADLSKAELNKLIKQRLNDKGIKKPKKQRN